MKEIDIAVKKMLSSRQTIALTGAGISTASGIPDFRGSHGLWRKYDPFEYAHMNTFMQEPARVWQLVSALLEMSHRSRPNDAHKALADMEKSGILNGIITQNIDGLHLLAGSKNVILYHGSLERAVCVECRITSSIDPEIVPVCPECGRIMKPGFTLFGEAVPPAAYLEARNLASFADIFMVIGTSANVQPAADLPFIAKEHGAYIIEMNRDITGLTNYITDCFIQGPLEETLPRLAIMAGCR